MNPTKLFPLVVTDKLAETRAYYTEKLGAELSFGGDTYIQVRFGGQDGPELCFMTPDAAPALGHLPKFGGDGLVEALEEHALGFTGQRGGRLATVVADGLAERRIRGTVGAAQHERPDAEADERERDGEEDLEATIVDGRGPHPDIMADGG